MKLNTWIEDHGDHLQLHVEEQDDAILGPDGKPQTLKHQHNISKTLTVAGRHQRILELTEAISIDHDARGVANKTPPKFDSVDVNAWLKDSQKTLDADQAARDKAKAAADAAAALAHQQEINA